MNIRRDGIVVADTGKRLFAIVSMLEGPDPLDLMSRVRHFSAILEVVSRDFTQHEVMGRDSTLHLDRFCRLARYLLRTAVYAQALAEGYPCISIRELAEYYCDPENWWISCHRIAMLLRILPHRI